MEYINKKLVFNLLPEREADSNKSTFGRILNIAGCNNYRGAAYLSSVSALKSGAGYVCLASINSVIDSVSSMASEITFYELKAVNGAVASDNDINIIDNFDVVSVGCGLSVASEVKDFLFKLFINRNENKKFVIDADGLNILAQINEEIMLKNCIITPHPKELSRLLNVPLDEILNNREKYARISAQKYDCVTVLKGHNTIVTNGDKIYYNTSGNSALAKAGSGDVLTGIAAGFMAQGLSPLDSALCSVFIHGLSGDFASYDLTEYCVLASDVIDYIPVAISEILSIEEERL